MLSAFADGAVFGERFGRGRPGVLGLHGWRSTHASMTAVLSGLDAIAVDLPGFGATPEPGDIWGAGEYAQALVPVIREMQEPVVVVGHSFGGRVALCIAAQHPEIVRALVLTGAPLVRHPSTARKPAFGFRVLKRAHKLGLVSDERMESERRKRGSADYRAATGLMRDVFVRLVNETYEAQLAQVKCHVEMVWGDADTEAPLALAREAQSILANATLRVVPGGTHWLPTENPTPIREAIDRCLA